MKVRQVAHEIAPDELAFAMTLADAAAAGRIPESGVGGKGLTLDMGDGSLSDISFNDTPVTRALFAVKGQFGDRWQAVMMRCWALAEIMEDERMDAFSSGDVADEAVIEIASVMPLNPSGNFNHNVFFKRVAKRFAERQQPDNS